MMTVIAAIIALTVSRPHHIPTSPLDRSLSTEQQYQDNIWADAHVFDRSKVSGAI